MENKFELNGNSNSPNFDQSAATFTLLFLLTCVITVFNVINNIHDSFPDFTFDGFSTDVCRGMVALKDVSFSNKTLSNMIHH